MESKFHFEIVQICSLMLQSYHMTSTCSNLRHVNTSLFLASSSSPHQQHVAPFTRIRTLTGYVLSFFFLSLPKRSCQLSMSFPPSAFQSDSKAVKALYERPRITTFSQDMNQDSLYSLRPDFNTRFNVW
jgi:hypothetical protein